MVAGGTSFGPISHGSQIVKMTQLGSTSLESFSRVLEFKNGVFGARVSFGIKSYVYIGPRVIFE